MKLTDRYLPEHHVAETNTIFTIYNDAILKGTRDTPEPDDARHFFSPASYSYELTSDEETFFANYYVTTTDPHLDEIQRIVDIKRECGGAVRIGENEKDLIDFIYDDVNLSRLLVAPVGRGKSTLLRYVFHYLVPQSASLRAVVRPVHIVMDRFAGEFAKFEGIEEIAAYIQNEIVRPRMRQAVDPHVRLDDADLWQKLKKLPSFAALDASERDLAVIYGTDGEVFRREVQLARSECRKHPDFPFAVARFLAQGDRARFVLIFDNVDKLSMRINEGLLSQIPNWTAQWGLRVLIPMRDTTAHRLADRSTNLAAAILGLRRIVWRDRNAVDYLRQRAAAIAAAVPSEARMTHERGGVVFEQRHHEEILQALFDLVLQHSDLLTQLAGGNLRKLSYLFRRCLSSARINEDRLKEAVFTKRTAGRSRYKLHFNTMITAILIGRHKTFFSRHADMQSMRDTLLNVYCNGQHRVNNRLIRTHLLRFFRPTSDNVRRSCAEVAELYCSFVNASCHDQFDKEATIAAVRHAMQRLLECNLLATPDHYRIDREPELDDAWQFIRTEGGTYYTNVFRNYFEYLQFMKDDAEYASNHQEILDCIRAPSREQQFVEVRKFLEDVLNEEYLFLRGMPYPKRRQFMQLFCPSIEDLFVVDDPIEHMLEFGTQRQNPHADIRAISEDAVDDFWDLRRRAQEHREELFPGESTRR